MNKTLIKKVAVYCVSVLWESGIRLSFCQYWSGSIAFGYYTTGAKRTKKKQKDFLLRIKIVRN